MFVRGQWFPLFVGRTHACGEVLALQLQIGEKLDP
jgi:hypothetical protein